MDPEMQDRTQEAAPGRSALRGQVRERTVRGRGRQLPDSAAVTRRGARAPAGEPAGFRRQCRASSSPGSSALRADTLCAGGNEGVGAPEATRHKAADGVQRGPHILGRDSGGGPGLGRLGTTLPDPGAPPSLRVSQQTVYASSQGPFRFHSQFTVMCLSAFPNVIKKSLIKESLNSENCSERTIKG